jgi:hypothetical protein
VPVLIPCLRLGRFGPDSQVSHFSDEQTFCEAMSTQLQEMAKLVGEEGLGD